MSGRINFSLEGMEVISDAEDRDDTAEERLYDFLRDVNKSTSFHTILDMLNVPFSLSELLEGFTEQLSEYKEHYNRCTEHGRNGIFVHLSDIVNTAEAARSLGFYWYRILEDKHKQHGGCKQHKKRTCDLISEDVGFLLYLLWSQEKSNEKLQPSEAEEKADELEVVEQFKEQEEKLWTRGFDIAKFKASNITKVELSDEEEADEDVMESTSCTATFPVYKINSKQYVLQQDIQHLFDLREDYFYAILAEWGENDKDFVAKEPCPLAILDTETENFVGKEIVGAQIKDIVMGYEKQGLPTEDEFLRIQKRLKIEHMGREEPRDAEETNPPHSINLWREALLADDENPKVLSLIKFFMFSNIVSFFCTLTISSYTD